MTAKVNPILMACMAKVYTQAYIETVMRQTFDYVTAKLADGMITGLDVTINPSEAVAEMRLMYKAVMPASHMLLDFKVLPQEGPDYAMGDKAAV